jgi:hypothetical protein
MGETGVLMQLRAPRTARRFLIALLAVVCAKPAVTVQTGTPSNDSGRADVLTIVNSHQVNVPGERARVLLLTTCRVVAEDFHRRPEEVDLKMTLVLGEREERYAIDESGRMTLYLESWSEPKFVDGVITGVMQRLTPVRTRKQMLSEILRRTEKIAPVSANRLRMPGANPMPRGAMAPDCISATKDAPCSWPNRAPYP